MHDVFCQLVDGHHPEILEVDIGHRPRHGQDVPDTDLSMAPVVCGKRKPPLSDFGVHHRVEGLSGENHLRHGRPQVRPLYRALAPVLALDVEHASGTYDNVVRLTGSLLSASVADRLARPDGDIIEDHEVVWERSECLESAMLATCASDPESGFGESLIDPSLPPVIGGQAFPHLGLDVDLKTVSLLCQPTNLSG